LSSQTVTPGETLTAHIDGVTPGAEVTVRFDGEVRGSATATAQPGSSTGSADITFTVPNDADPSRPHTIVLSGTGFSCDPGPVNEVLGETINRGAGGSGGGSLARTGVEVMALVALGLGLVVGGRALMRSARRRRSRVERRRPQDLSNHRN
jgi:hypothetical protein